MAKTRPVKVKIECPDCMWESKWVTIVAYDKDTIIGDVIWVLKCPDCDGHECFVTHEKWLKTAEEECNERQQNESA